MKMKKFSMMIAAGMMTLGLAACGNSSNDESAASSAADTKSEDVLAKVKEKGVLKVGTSADFAPFEFHTMVDGKDEIVGADIAMAKEIADQLGVKVEFMDMEFNSVLASLQQGKVDMAISGISATPERKESFDFSDNYYNPPQRVLVNKKNLETYTSIDSLKGKKVGAQKGSIQEGIVKDQIPDADMVSVTKVPNLVIELNKGSIDALVLEETIGESYIEQNPDLSFANIDLKSSKDEAYAIAMPKNSGEFKTEVDKIIKKLIDDGTIEKNVQEAKALAKTAAEKE